MRKLSSLLLTFAAFIVFSIPVHAQQNAGMEGIHASGLFVTIDDFNNLYGKPNSSDDALINLKKNAKMILKNISMNNEEVSFVADVSYNDQNKIMNASGKLYKSYKQANSINSYSH